MVQKYQSPVRVYKYPFELIMAVSVLNDLEKLKYFQFSLSQHFGKKHDFFGGNADVWICLWNLVKAETESIQSVVKVTLHSILSLSLFVINSKYE